jgi:polygalacturonase
MREVSVREFGGNIQAALDAGAPVVRIPAGEYRTRTLRIGSNTRLIAESGAHIIFADGAGKDSQCFLLTNRDLSTGNTDIHIEGGRWDGNNAGNPRGPDQPGSYTGAAFNFRNVRGLTIQDVTLHDATAYYVRLTEVTGFRFERIRFTSSQLRPNQDGIHVAGFCEDGLIRDISASGVGVTNDDLVALLADDALHRAQNLDLKCGPVRRVRIENLRADDCHSFVRLASVRHWIEEVDVRDVRGGCRVCALNCDALRYCMGPVFDARDPRFAAGVGLLRNVTLTGFELFKSKPTDLPLFLLETRMQNFVLRDVRRDRTRDLSPAAPLLRVRGIETDGLTMNGRPPARLRRNEAFTFNEDGIREFSVLNSLQLPVPEEASEPR